ncbi:MAG TPA: class I SAM-dependent methyltransferase [Vicinamibacteria bacterium]|nr:class I SAM-dependent methyltransferase [Vicinamibacteria bacterium]
MSAIRFGVVKRDWVRYLEAKRGVDDRALDRRVWDRLKAELRALGRSEIDIADIGAGTGTGLDRMVAWGLLQSFERVRYTAVEPDSELRERIRDSRYELPIEMTFVGSELDELAGLESRFDLVVAHALLDLLPLETSVDKLLAIGRRGGLLYCPITFDGETLLEPEVEADEAILETYHGTMARKGRTGRLLFHALTSRGARVLEVASSDWIVHPLDGRYAGDEQFFLQFLVELIAGAVRDRIDEPLLSAWRDRRHRQILDANLVLVAHQMDVLARIG